MPEIPIPKTYHRFNMEPQERIDSYADMAEILLDRLAEAADNEERALVLAVSLASTYVEGAYDGRTYGDSNA